MSVTRWPAPAKLNLFLHITGRRDDGYHELQTAFQFLDYGDEIELRVRRDGRIRRVTEVPGVTAEEDLVVRAARALKSVSASSLGVDIAIRKRIPMGGGLGGGSSNAATTLVGLNRVWMLGLSDDVLAELGLKIGADVPVFVHGRAAWAEGIGEVLKPAQFVEPWYLVVHPGCQVSTAAVFSAPGLTRNTRPMKISDLVRPGYSGGGPKVSPNDLWERARNDCEAVVRKQYPCVDDALRWLSGFHPARMTGTGACVFAPLADPDEGKCLLERLPDGWRGFVARGLNRSPLLSRVKGQV